MVLKIRWDDDYERCAGCGTRSQEKPHVAEGLCTDCFPKKYGDFGLGDAPPAWAGAGVPLPPAPVVEAVKAWHSLWPACLVCGTTKTKHMGKGLCNTCGVRSSDWKRRGIGLTLIWLPFSKFNIGAYTRHGSERWVTVRDWDEAVAYLERRGAAGQFPAGGKVVIRRTKDAEQLPELVIRPVAA